MRGRAIACWLALAGFALPAQAAWRNLTETNHLGGCKASDGYLRGKVVFVVKWSAADAETKKTLLLVEDIWQNFRSKPFVALGGTQTVPDAATGAWVKGLALTFPNYADAGLETGEPRLRNSAYFYVVSALGRVLYQGTDDGAATQAAVVALTDLAAPKDEQAAREFLEYELSLLPGRAYLRMHEFKKKYPKAAREYAERFRELQSVPEVKKLSELVAFAARAKDHRPFGPRQEAKRKDLISKIKSALSKYAGLKESSDPRVVQEAKNALADLTRVLARISS